LAISSFSVWYLTLILLVKNSWVKKPLQKTIYSKNCYILCAIELLKSNHERKNSSCENSIWWRQGLKGLWIKIMIATSRKTSFSFSFENFCSRASANLKEIS
jgi:hypothetical protein